MNTHADAHIFIHICIHENIVNSRSSGSDGGTTTEETKNGTHIVCVFKQKKNRRKRRKSINFCCNLLSFMYITCILFLSNLPLILFHPLTRSFLFSPVRLCSRFLLRSFYFFILHYVSLSAHKFGMQARERTHQTHTQFLWNCTWMSASLRNKCTCDKLGRLFTRHIEWAKAAAASTANKNKITRMHTPRHRHTYESSVIRHKWCIWFILC